MISLIKNPDFSRANCGVAANDFKWNFEMFSIIPFGSIARSAHSGRLYSKTQTILQGFLFDGL